MDFEQIYHFLFETYLGIGVLIGATIILCIIISALLELRTRKRYRDRGEEPEDDEWSLFDDEDEEEPDDE